MNTNLICDHCGKEIEPHIAIKISYSDEFYVFDTNSCLLEYTDKNRPFCKENPTAQQEIEELDEF